MVSKKKKSNSKVGKELFLTRGIGSESLKHEQFYVNDALLEIVYATRILGK